MTIERLHFENGYPFGSSSKSLDFAQQLLLRNINNLQMLPEGEYSLTPSRLKNGSMEHNLVVFKDGTAVYRGLPNDRNVGMIELSAREGKFKSGGRFILIPQDTEVVVISGTTEDGNFGIYDIILYLPDPPQDQMI